MSKPIPVDDNSFEQEVYQEKGPVMVEFFATWCPHCQRMAPVIEDIANEYEGKVKVCVVDVDIAEKYTNEYKISGTPTMFFFKDGKQQAKLVGEQSIEELREQMDALL